MFPFLIFIVFSFIHSEAFNEIFTLDCNRRLHFFPESPLATGVDGTGILGTLNFAYSELYEEAKELCPSLNDEDFDSRFALSLPEGFLRIFEYNEFPSVEHACAFRYHSEISLLYYQIQDVLPSGKSLPSSCNHESGQNGMCRFSIPLEEYTLNVAIESCPRFSGERYENRIPYVSVTCDGCDDLLKPCSESTECGDDEECRHVSEMMKFSKGFWSGDSFDDVYHPMPTMQTFSDLGFNDGLSEMKTTPQEVVRQFFDFVLKRYWGSELSLTTFDTFKFCMPDAGFSASDFFGHDLSSCSQADVSEAFFCGEYLFTDPDACNGHGVCRYPFDHDKDGDAGLCVCEEGYEGTLCETEVNGYMCNGVMKGDAAVCSYHGTCTAVDTCECYYGYGGSDCEESMTCNGVAFDAETVCSAHGTCTEGGVCECQQGYGGIDCATEYTCFGVSGSDTENSCRGQGKCTGNDECTCNVGYTGEQCEERDICGEYLASNPAVCNGRGACREGVCTCYNGFSGDLCEVDDRNCYDIQFENSTVCSGRGQCLYNEDSQTWNCKCDPGYQWGYCQSVATCDGISAEHPEVCSGFGTCTRNEKCVCEYPFTGTYCNERITCNEIDANSDKVCSGFGLCVSSDTCACDEEHEGTWCSEKIQCDGIAYDDETVCGGEGYCTKKGCRPKEYYSNEDCGCVSELYDLFQEWDGSFEDGSSVDDNDRRTGKHFDTYIEDLDYEYSEKKPIPLLYLHEETVYVLPTHEHYHFAVKVSETNELIGQIEDLMDDYRYYYHSEGDGVPECSECHYKYWSPDSWLWRFTEWPNYEHIEDEDEDIVKMLDGYELPDWFKRFSTPSTCTLNTYLEKGSCSFRFTGFADLFCDSEEEETCQLDILVKIIKPEGENVLPDVEVYCDGAMCHNWYNLKSCLNDDDCEVGTCQTIMQSVRYNEENYVTPLALYEYSWQYDWTFSFFDDEEENWIWPSASPWNNDYNRVFYSDQMPNPIETFQRFLSFLYSSYSSKDVNEVKICSYEWFDEDEWNQWMNATIKRNPEGYSLKVDGLEDWEGAEDFLYYHEEDDLPICYGMDKSNEAVCSGNGVCVSDNNCVCYDGYYGEQCSLYKCYDVRSTDPQVCGGHGECTSAGVCECEPNYYGLSCNVTTCFGTISTCVNVCSQKGECVGYDDCQCDNGWAGDECTEHLCFSETDDDADVCSGHGTCTGPNTCECEPNYYGKKCELKMCYDKLSNNPNVCNGNGLCTDDDTCECLTGYKGEECDVPMCGGYWADGDQSLICSGKGECVDYQVCACDEGYAGPYCEYTLCNGKYSILQDNFEGEGLSTVWDSDETTAYPSEYGCGSMTDDGQSLYFSGKGDRIALTQEISVTCDSKQEYYLSFNFLLASGSTGCDTVYYSDVVHVYAHYEDEQTGEVNKELLKELSPMNYMKKNKKVAITFTPRSNFRIEITQPVRYKDTFGQFSIDNFFLSFSEFPEVPCNFNGLCIAGECVCNVNGTSGDECAIIGCETPQITEMNPSEGKPSEATVVLLYGCFEQITKCRFYGASKDGETCGHEVVATVIDDGTIACTVPPRDNFGEDSLHVDVYQNELKTWFHYEGGIFTYDDNAQNGGGDTVVGGLYGVFWHEEEMNADETYIHVEMEFVFLKPYGDWYNCNCSSTYRHTERVNNVYIHEENVDVSGYVVDSNVNPEYLELIDILVTCSYVGSGEEAPCYSYVRPKTINIPVSAARSFCDNWYSLYEEYPEWNNNLRSCPSSRSDAESSSAFDVEVMCSEDNENIKFCDYYYPDAYECYVSNSAEPYVRRCCYDYVGDLIESGESMGLSEYCSKESDDCKVPNHDKISTTHYESDYLPCEVCGLILDETDEVQSRRPSSQRSVSSSTTCSGSGDPHFRTLSGINYNFYGEGSYYILKNDNELEIQGYFYGSAASTTTALVMIHHGVNSQKIQVRATGLSMEPEIRVDDVVQSLSGAISIRGCSYSVDSASNRYNFQFSSGELVSIVLSSQSLLNWYISNLPSVEYADEPLGLCGCWNGDKASTFMTPDQHVRDKDDEKERYEFSYAWAVPTAEDNFYFPSDAKRVHFTTPPVLDPSTLPDLKDMFTNETYYYEVLDLCTQFAPDNVEECVYDMAVFDQDEVISYTLMTSAIIEESIVSTTTLPSVDFGKNFGKEHNILIRRNTENVFSFDLSGGNMQTREINDLELKVNEINLLEDYNAIVFNYTFELMFETSIDRENNRLMITFTDPSVIEKVFSIEIQIGDETNGYSSTNFQFETRCESGMGGDSCSEIACNDIEATSDYVCSGRGTCVDSNVCECAENYIGNDCQYGYLVSEAPKVSIEVVDGSGLSGKEVYNYNSIVLKAVLDYQYDNELEVSYKWSVLGSDIEEMLVTPRNQKQIKFAPYAFEDYSEQLISLDVYTAYGTVECTKVLIVLPSLPEEDIVLTQVTVGGNEVSVDCSNFQFSSKVFYYYYKSLDAADAEEVLLLISEEENVDLMIPIEGNVRILVKVYQSTSRREVIVSNDVYIQSTPECTETSIEAFIDSSRLFDKTSYADMTEQEIAERIMNLCYLSLWIVDHEEEVAQNMELEYLDELRYKILNEILLYGIKDETYIRQTLSILNDLMDLSVELEINYANPLFEVALAQYLYQTVYFLDKDLDDETETLVYASFTKVMEVMMSSSSKTSDRMQSLIVTLESIFDALMSSKVLGQFESYSSSKFSMYSMKQTYQSMEGKELTYGSQGEVNCRFSFPQIYNGGEETNTMLFNTQYFKEDPFMHDGYDCKGSVLRISMQTCTTCDENNEEEEEEMNYMMSENGYYRVTLKGKFSEGGNLAYWNEINGEWIQVKEQEQEMEQEFNYLEPVSEVDGGRRTGKRRRRSTLISRRSTGDDTNSGKPVIRIIDQTDDQVVFETNAPQATFGVVKEKIDWWAIISKVLLGSGAVVIGVPLLCVVLCVSCMVAVVCCLVFRKLPMKKIIKKMIPEEKGYYQIDENDEGRIVMHSEEEDDYEEEDTVEKMEKELKRIQSTRGGKIRFLNKEEELKEEESVGQSVVMIAEPEAEEEMLEDEWKNAPKPKLPKKVMRPRKSALYVGLEERMPTDEWKNAPKPQLPSKFVRPALKANEESPSDLWVNPPKPKVPSRVLRKKKQAFPIPSQLGKLTQRRAPPVPKRRT